MRCVIRRFDAFLRRCYGVEDLFPEQSDLVCILRVRLTHAARAVALPDGRIPVGAPVLELHLWNERIPRIPPGGPDLAWARRTQRLFVDSLREVARRLRSDSRLAGVQAVTGATVLIFSPDGLDRNRLMKRLGFAVFPVRNPLGRFGRFWENAYTWAIMWTYNPASLRLRRFRQMRRDEFWMTRSKFVEGFGP
jgi:YkoP domain